MKKKRSIRSANNRARRRRHGFVDFLTVVICLAGIAVALYCFRNLIYKSLATDADVPVGTITFKKKSPRRRLQHENVWEYLKLQSTIYKGDYILTEDLSEAQLIFKDTNYTVDQTESNVAHVVLGENEIEQIKTGSAEIHANSMMRVGDDNLLHFISGSVSLSSGSRTEDLSIQVGENIYTLEKNTSALFSMGTSKAADGKQTATIYVSSGKVKEQKVETKGSGAAVEIGAGQVRTVQVVPEQVETKADDSIIPGAVRNVAKKTVEGTKKAAGTVVAKVTGNEVPKESSSVTQAKTSTKASATSSAAASVQKASFEVLVPSASYSITQDKDTQEAVPFYWTNINDIRVEFSYNQSFNNIIDTAHFSSKDKKASVFLSFAKPDNVIYWRALPEGEKYTSAVSYPNGKILVHNPKEKNLKNALTAAYGKEYAQEIQKAVEETQQEEKKNQEQ